MATFSKAMLLAGKTCAITGGVSGIGRAIAIEYLRQGGSVAVNHLGDSKSMEQFNSLKNEVPRDSKLIGFGGDIGKIETGKAFVEATLSRLPNVSIFGTCSKIQLSHWTQDR
jgi:L-rhamnose 1-dehydrogenase